MKRYLHRHAICNYVALSKPFLSKKNVCRLKQWAANHEKWCDERWDRVVFSKELPFTVVSTILLNRVWRQPSRRDHRNNLVHNFKSGNLSISVWAAFSVRGRNPLIRIGGTLKEGHYCNILQKYLLPFLLSIIPHLQM